MFVRVPWYETYRICAFVKLQGDGRGPISSVNESFRTPNFSVYRGEAVDICGYQAFSDDVSGAKFLIERDNPQADSHAANGNRHA